MLGRYARHFCEQLINKVMNGNIGILILCVSVLHVLFVESKRGKLIEPEIEEYDDVQAVKYFGQDYHTRQVDSTVFKTLNKYYCSLDSIIEGSSLLVYGSNGWTFPVQDVNLTLSYPPPNKTLNEVFDFRNQNEVSSEEDDEGYIVSGFKVILFIDGVGSEGYIIDGGVLQESITLSFVSSQLSSLRYQFWVYGVRKDAAGVVELNSHYRLC